MVNHTVVYVAEATDAEAGASDSKEEEKRVDDELLAQMETPLQHLAKTARGVKVAAAMKPTLRKTRQTESARTLLTHEPHDLLAFYDKYSLSKTARRLGGLRGGSLRVLPYVWPLVLGMALAWRLDGGAVSVLMFSCSLLVITSGGQATWIKCRQLTYIVDVTDGRCLSDPDACYKWVKRCGLFCKAIILLMIFVATPLEVAYIIYVFQDVIGWWIGAIPIGLIYGASHIAGATVILGAMMIVLARPPASLPNYLSVDVRAPPARARADDVHRRVLRVRLVGRHGLLRAQRAQGVRRRQLRRAADEGVPRHGRERRRDDRRVRRARHVRRLASPRFDAFDFCVGIDEYLLLQGRQKANSLRTALADAEYSVRTYNEHVNKLLAAGITLLLFGGGAMTLACVLICVGGHHLFATIFFGYLVFVCFTLVGILMLAAAAPGEVHSVTLRKFNTIENYFVEGLAFDLIQIYLNNLELGIRISGTVVTFSTVVSVLSTLLLSVGLTFWGG